MAIFNGTLLDDTFTGNDEDDIINGNGGNDTLKGGGGNDTIDGGDGYDIIQGGLGRDTLNGGAGRDRVDYTTFNGDGIYDLVAGTANLGVFTETILNFETITTGNGNDTITLVNADSLPYLGYVGSFAGGGNDIVNGSAGRDMIDGNAGNDIIYGGEGNDILNGGSDQDTLDGGSGDDNLYGDAGNDIINGGAGDDSIQGGLGQDTLDGGAGSDIVDYQTFSGNGIYNLDTGTANLGVFTEQMLNFESIITGTGNDIIYGNAADNGIYGNAGNDTLYGGAGNDEIYGNAGNDTLYGGAGNDEIYGDAGDDFIQGGLGQDYLDGVAGTDTVDYTTFNGGGTYNLTAGTAILPGAFTETMLSFENIYTGAGNDTIVGTSGVNRLYGGAGDDNISGGDGNDYIQGGLGQDTLDGGTGNDTVDYTTFSGNGVYDLFNGTANLGVFTEQMLNFESIITGAGNDTIRGTAVANYLDSGDGNDDIFGDAGDDTIYGGLGNDQLYGNSGDDVLFGEGGSDKFHFGGAALSGGNTVANSIGRDSIYDFTQGQDKIVLSKTAFLNISTSVSILGVPVEILSFGVATTDATAATRTAAIVYSQSSGNLFYNPNGSAAGFTTAGGPNGGNFAYVGLPAGVDLGYSDFVLIA